MKRQYTAFLIQWLNSSTRKPIVIRGARQVGKTWLIRDLANSQGRHLIELNFEKRPDQESLFSSNDPQEILVNIAAAMGGKVYPSKSILFMDEIQAAPHLLEKLRWFAEDMPELPVVAAGSLLDFALAQHEFSMPVGRINYFYLEPLSFEEFLNAMDQNELVKYLQNYTWNITIPEILHLQLNKLIKEYLIVGGMPAAVANWIKEKSPQAVNQIHFDLLATYRDDFAKYRGRLSTERLEDVMSSVPRQLGNKFVYKHANSDVEALPLKKALDLLAKARVCHRIIATSANGLPLAAEADEKFSKVIMLDCGLCSVSLGLSLHQLRSITDISLINNGGMAEQLVGQLLRTIAPPYIPPSLYYWQRDMKGSAAEVDYIIQHETQIIPIEVKAGTTGTLKSLHQFMKEKKKPIAVRINSGVPRLGSIRITEAGEYSLLSIPFYLVGQLYRLLNAAQTNL
ncbi:MAG: ATP-binding protein [Verrucomicrobia bacterium]|nr:ATP-binding protein [Verrucomicrobiota bacterium]